MYNVQDWTDVYNLSKNNSRYIFIIKYNIYKNIYKFEYLFSCLNNLSQEKERKNIYIERYNIMCIYMLVYINR